MTEESNEEFFNEANEFDDDLSADLEAAMSQAEGEEVEEAPEEQQSVEEEAPSQEIEEPESQPEAEVEAEEPQSEEKEAKAPASWTPAAREGWKDIPESAKAQIAKREAEMTKYMQDTATSRKAVQQLQKTLEPYHNSMVAAGVNDPFKVIGALMNNDHIMRHGTAQNKAELVAGMIQNFGVDIGTLDNLLSGEVQQQPQVDPNIQSMIDQQLAPYKQVLQQQQYDQNMQQEQVSQQARQQVGEFGKDKEFFNDVRNSMADIIQAASDSGKEISLDRAYEIATSLDKGIQKVMDDRKTLQASQALQTKQNAASSVTGLSGTPKAKQYNSGNEMKDDISAAWDSFMDG